MDRLMCIYLYYCGQISAHNMKSNTNMTRCCPHVDTCSNYSSTYNTAMEINPVKDTHSPVYVI